MNMIEALKNPGMKYRPVPFWSWNDKLEPQELRNQINLMHEAGLGGYFMHARGGLLTEYMGNEWFDCIRACVDEGKKLGMNTWAYDENGWPSGFGDGMVNGMGLRYQQKYLRLAKVQKTEAKCNEHTIGFFTADGSATVENIEAYQGQELLHVYFDVNPYYVDTLDADVIKVFLEKIYQQYQQRLETLEWQGLAGFFTDEPQVSRNGIPWSFIMEAEYEKAYGEKLLPLLPQLLVETGNCHQTRYRFWRLVTMLFMNNFMKQIHDWCEERGCKITGHHVLEETYESQLTSNGAIMPNYQYYHIPGMDWLGRHIKPVSAPVQVASVCAQTGKKQILSETFALCGWNVKMEELKWIGQWQMVHGINLICQHLEGYSLKGIRKRDYPASLFRHLPWWGDYRRFNDYVSRLGVLLSEGEIKTDVLILHGQSTAWLCFTGQENNQTISKYFDSFNQLSELFDSAHVNYHYGDETMITMHGAVKNGKFVIGQQNYGLVVVPQLKNFSPEVYAALRQFVQAGGKVLAVKNQIEQTPVYVGGESCSDIFALTDKFVWFDSEAELASALHQYTGVCPVVKAGTLPADVMELTNQVNDVAFTKRYFADLGGVPAVVHYFVNNDLAQGYDSEIYLDGTAVERFDAADGKFYPIHFKAVDGKLCVPHYFCPAGDLVLAVKYGTAATIPATEYFRRDPALLQSGKPEVELGGEYRVEVMTPNLLTLDHCAFWFDGELQEKYEYVLCIQDRMLKLKRPVELAMEFKFNVGTDYDLSGDLFLVMEIPQQFDIVVNGKTFASVDSGFMFDPAFRKINIKTAVKLGENTIKLKTLFSQPDHVYQCIEAAKVFESEKNKLSYTMEIEAIYLSGDFGVEVSGQFQPLPREAVRVADGFALGRRPQQASLAKLHEAGLPFFSGSITIAKDFDLAPGQENGRYLVFDRQMATVSKFKINGKAFNPVIWKPFCMSLDGYLQAGKNHVEIELTNSLRNMLGPHHLDEGESYCVCPASFYKESGVFYGSWVSGSWNAGYCLVEFGIDNLRIVYKVN